VPEWILWAAVVSAALTGETTAAIAQEQSPTIRSYIAPGNLESNYNLGCIELTDVKPVYNPVDLFKASKSCIITHRYDDAVRLFAIGNAYGRYDMRRVADSTAHQALMVARMAIFDDLSDADQQGFQASTVLNDPASKRALCDEISRIGPPSYAPRYMVQHGMGAFFGSTKDGLVKDFDSKSAWLDVVSSYLKCSSS
jgi:hypothetical protein